MVEGSVSMPSSELQAQNVQFKDRVQPYQYSVATSSDETRQSQDSTSVPLDEFFSRPIKIAEYEWGTGISLGQEFDPWSLFFENTRVLNRLTNYNLLRCNLRLRVLINGNAFQYGRAIMYYRPLAEFDQMSADTALITQDLIGGSQCPHIYLDPTTSQGGELVLPFFYYKNYLSIPDQDWSEMGQIYLRSFNQLKHANGATDKVTISIFAMAEDVHVSVLTTTDPDALAPQSDLYDPSFQPHGELEQANRAGVISGPATMVAKVAGALSSIPSISPFALATQMVANATAKAARIFGYCRPAITKSPEPFRPTVTSSLALTNAPDTAAKLTVDDKQELSIDPSVSGIVSKDPLNIKGIATRESYLTTFDWEVGTAPDQFLWNSRVVPTLWGVSAAGNALHMTPMCYAAVPFQYWTGSIRFRFQIVASNYHRGRLRFVWDPNFIMNSGSNYNIAHQTIVDISEEKDFTMEIANGQELTLLEKFDPGGAIFPFSSTTPYNNKLAGNGVLGVYVLNELTVPNSTVNNDIQINVFVSAGDDFEVFVPSDEVLKYTAADFIPQSSMEPQSDMDPKVDTPSENTEEPSAPVQHQETEMHDSSSESSKLNMVFTGEAIASLRPLLKRYTIHTSRGTLDSGNVCVAGTFPQYPYLRGQVIGAINTTSTGEPYNYCNTLLMHWATWPFAGYRGSTRWKILPRGNLDNSQPISLYVERQSDDFPDSYGATAVSQENYSSVSEAAHRVVQQGSFSTMTNSPAIGALGMAYSHESVNATLEVEIPYYSKYRFTPGKRLNHTTVSRDDAKLPPPWTYRIFTNGEPSTAFDFACAAGDDFQVYFWTGIPRLYRENAPPPPQL